MFHRVLYIEWISNILVIDGCTVSNPYQSMLIGCLSYARRSWKKGAVTVRSAHCMLQN